MKRWSKEEISYCSNVHAGETAEQIESNIETYLAAVREQQQLDWISSGLWLSEQAAEHYTQYPASLQRLQSILDKQQVRVHTLNAFPIGGFHQEVVKQEVYKPDWSQSSRLEYSINCATLLSQLLPADRSYGSISTLPLGYSEDWTAEKHKAAASLLLKAVDQLQKIEYRTGKQITLCLEMEPGCVLETTEQLVTFFTETLFPAAQSNGIEQGLISRYIGACYDICHQSVMFERHHDSLSKIIDADIRIGKIQVSSALEVMDPGDRETQYQLQDYAEPRYLHQVRCINSNTRQLEGCPDLGTALEQKQLDLTTPWRVHFHIPIQSHDLDSDKLATTQNGIIDVLQFLADHPDLKPDLEVETYTWEVLPKCHRPTSSGQLIKGLIEELNWLSTQLHHFKLLIDQS